MTNFKGRVQRFEHGEYRVSIELPPDSKRDKDEKTDNQKPGYQIDRFPDGTNICEIDSIQSQANRIEPQFKTIKDGKLVPQITIEVGTQTVNLLDAGHRAADAVVRMSSLAKEFHDAWLAAKAGDLFALATLAPTAIVFGAWDSRSSQAKLQRLIKAHIRATNVLERTRSAQYTPAADYVGLGAIDESVNVGEDDKNNPSQEVFCADPATCFDGDHYPTLDPAKLAKGKVKPAEYLFDCPPWHLCLDTETIHAQRWPTVPGSRWVNYTRPEEKRTFSFARRRLQVSGLRERGEVSVPPNFRRKLRLLGQLPPDRLQRGRLVGKVDARVVEKQVIHRPCFALSHRNRRKRDRVVRQPQESLLRESAKETPAIVGQSSEPGFGWLVMLVSDKGEREPDVDIKKMHSNYALEPRYLLRRESPECAHSSGVYCQASRFLRAAIPPFSCSSWLPAHRARAGTRPHASLREGMRLRQIRPHRFQLDLESACSNYRLISRCGQQQAYFADCSSRPAPARDVWHKYPLGEAALLWLPS
jgi:CRISPR-associated protein Csb1